ncbi:MAG: hypothetical protein COS08_07025 [Euryarchaeota archaeon CG01_land_8_20_14_3_00_38_12]|nr:MAG: hypothetical protein COS08_07025 [Euryarchaeota archaeon CG01_land_8_20_14_3_00_38_12]
MQIPKEIIDNSEGNKLVSFLNEVLRSNPNTNLDIATAFFDIKAYAMVKDNINGVNRFRLLLGKAPEIKTDTTLGDELLKNVKEEVEGFELSKEANDNVKTFIEFLKKDNVEIRLYDKEFLHGKTYIFNNLIIIGSSNFTSAGLTRYGELNTWKQESQAVYTRKEWFEKFWQNANDFKTGLIGLLENSRFGSREYTPYEIYIKALYELQKDELKAEEKKEEVSGLPPSRVNLTEFQEDAIPRIVSRLKKYGGILVADSVGLGKTWIAKKIIEEIGYYKRGVVLTICPAQLRRMWKDEIKSITVTENVLSQEELATTDFLDKAKRAVGKDLTKVQLIVVDESHNFRNPLSNRWENFFTLVNDNIAKNGKKPDILFLTATPINNTIWDLYWQVMLLVLGDKNAFIKENISDIFKFFKEVEGKGDPSSLNDLLNEISIRRTRDYIKKNYPDAYIIRKLPDGTEKEMKIIFPERTLDNINYELDKTYKGMYKEISDAIIHRLTMAYYRILKYKKEEKLTAEEVMTLNRMIAISGIFKTILLKRLESSIEAFKISVSRHIHFLEELKKLLLDGRFLTKQSFYKYLMSADEEIEEFLETLEDFKLEDYKKEELFEDIDKDIKILKEILEKVSRIKPEDDAKLKVLKNNLLTLSKKGQVLLFTYYADTLEHIYNQILKDKDFSHLKIEAISSSGRTTSKTPNEREHIREEFFDKKINILMSTDVLSEGMNLQTAQFLINYDLHWNPTRMIQRAGRIDRIGSQYKRIYVHNFFPEDELEELLRLVQVLQTKIIEIDESVGLDQTILGEKIHPKVFGIVRRIKNKDTTVLDELEKQVYGGGEKFYQPLKDYMKKRAVEDIDSIPYGVHSGLKKNKAAGIFFYYKYGDDFHFWYLYDVSTGNIIKNKTEIIDFIECPSKEKRVIPNFFDKIFEVNRIILEEIEGSYKDLEQKRIVDTSLAEIDRDKSTKIVKTLIREMDLQIDDYLSEFPEEKEIQGSWEPIKNKLLSIPYTKKRLSALRKLWRQYKTDKDWKGLIKELNDFLYGKGIFVKEPIPPFDKKLLKLIVVDLIS